MSGRKLALFGRAARDSVSKTEDECEMNGRGERIRTSGLYVPNVALYQAKLHPDTAVAMPVCQRAFEERSGRALNRSNTQF